LSLNRATYVRNNPVGLTDPSGGTPSNTALKDVGLCRDHFLASPFDAIRRHVLPSPTRR